MRKAQKQEVLECINSLHQAHREVKEALLLHNYDVAQNMLSECQEFAVFFGETIEGIEGEGHISVLHVEEYCETLFWAFQEIINGQINVNKIYKNLKKQLLCIENSVKNDIPVKKEIAFFPYKVSMWDSLESIYLTAREDPECDAYCVPIPYFDINADHSFGRMHYEGGEYPEGVEIIDWEKYNFEDRRPDVIYIHNPYDGYNLVTSVHPRYYSYNLKKYTDTLVYIPYYVTSGGMLEAQSMLPAYLYVDYIVIQSPKFREHFDKSIPNEKFLPFGSPKVDKMINKCKNLPKPSKEWLEKMTRKDGGRKRVIFYNTGISAMLKDTGIFLSKMEYVFRCVMDREGVCLLWRPHPLLESTFDSMRPQFRPVYDALKRIFVENNLGIYDTNPDIAESIALSDAYIGDAGTSVVSLFGVAGKPIFILNDQILEEPGEEEWRKDIHLSFNYLEQDRFNVIQGNKLYISEANRYEYKYFCNLVEGVCVNEYPLVYEINGKLYACPSDAKDILVIGKQGVEKRIALEKRTAKGAMFSYPRKFDKYLFLLPINYPAVVRYDTVTEQIKYFTDNIDVFVKEKNGRKITGDSLIYQGNLYIASPTDNRMYKLDIESGESNIIELPIQSRGGNHGLFEYKGDIWLTPYSGRVIVRWNPNTNEVREYEGVPENFLCINPVDGSERTETPFCVPAFYGENMYLTSFWSNMDLQLNVNTGEFRQWIPIYEIEGNRIEGLKLKEDSTFLQYKLEEGESNFKIYLSSKQKLYSVNLGENEFHEIEIQFDMDELKTNEPGFCKYSESLPYACIENHFNTLSRFLDGKTVGNPFSKEKQCRVYKEIVANSDSGCGKKVHEFVKKIR